MKKKKRKTPEQKEIDNTKEKHHIIPVSRLPKGKRKNDRRNISIVRKKSHVDYHRIFIDLMPNEIIIYLVKYFWKGQIEWVELALEQLKEERNERQRRQ